MNNTTIVTTEQIENNTGFTYRASGNLFIVKQTCRTVPHAYSGQRGSIIAFSAGSGIRMRRYLRECRANYQFMVTLTYPGFFPTNGTETKEHLRRFLQEMQRYDARDQNYSGVRQLHSAFWFLEFQERGAPHYHIFANRIPPKEWISKRWYEIVGSEDDRHLRAGTNRVLLSAGRAGTISYASKYAAKLEQKTAPVGFENIGRYWGVYGDRITMSASTFVSRAESLKTDVSWSTKKLLDAVKLAIDKGKGEVVRREDGVLIVVINDPVAMQRIRMQVSWLSAKTMRIYDLFEDAEVEYGEIYDG